MDVQISVPIFLPTKQEPESSIEHCSLPTTCMLGFKHRMEEQLAYGHKVRNMSLQKLFEAASKVGRHILFKEKNCDCQALKT